MGNGLLIYMMVMDARQRNEANRAISIGKRHTDCPTASICKLQALRIFQSRLDVKAQFSGIPVPDIVSESSIRAYPNADTNDGCQCIRLEVQIIVPILAMPPRDILKAHYIALSTSIRHSKSIMSACKLDFEKLAAVVQ